MKTAWVGLRAGVERRREAFASGLIRVGYKVRFELTHSPQPSDVCVIWNRYGAGDVAARHFEARGAAVLICENSSWGNSFAGHDWYSIWPRFHNRADMIEVGPAERWDSLGVELAPWRDGGETVGLPQRGIGPAGVAMPRTWVPPGCDRIRRHPGVNPCKPLDDDLADAGKVVTWGSGAAIKALMLGIKVESHMPKWCGEQDNTDEGRLNMLRRLSWAQWRLSEIEAGDPFRWLLEGQ